MSVIAGLQDFRREGPPADIGVFQFPASVLVFQHTFAGTTYVCAVRAGERGWVLIDYGTDASTVIQSATIDALTPGRTWKEKVVLKGRYNFNATVKIPSYTVIQIQGLLRKADGLNQRLFENSDFAGGNNDIEICGGIIDENQANQVGNIAGLYFENVTDVSIINVKIINGKYRPIEFFFTAPNIRVLITGCTFQDCSLDAIYICAQKAIIANNLFKNIGDTAVDISGHEMIPRYSTEIVVKGNQFEDIKAGVVVARESTSIVIDGNNFSNATGNSISGSNYTHTIGPKEVVVSNNVFKTGGDNRAIRFNKSQYILIIGNKSYAYRHGVDLVESPDCTVIGNKVINSGEVGILLSGSSHRCLVEGNTCLNSGQTADFRYGISIQGSDYCSVIGNNCFDNQTGSETQSGGIQLAVASSYNYVAENICILNKRYGIVIGDGGSINNVITRNRFYGNLVGPISDAGTGTIIKHNIGYVTENSGTATIANGTNSVNVAHGLAGAPDIVVLGPSHAEVEDARVTNKDTLGDGTTFTIAVTNNVTADRTVDWYAEYKP